MLYSPEIAWFYAQRGFKDKNVTGSVKPNGWIAATPHEVDQLNDSLATLRVQSHDRIHFEGDLLKNMRDLERFIALLKSRNVEPILITTPVSELYAKYAQYDVVFQNDSLLKSIAKRHNWQYYNYFSDSRFSLSDFNDNDHLNPQGAKKLSQILNTEAIVKIRGNAFLK